MAQRSGQAGTVVVKGRWWTGRYYEDVPGQISRRRKSIPIGLKEQMTKPQARNKLRAMLQEMGINTAAHLERSLKPVQTFLEYADWWEKNIQPTHQPSSGNSSHYILKKHLRPRFGDMPLDSITQESVQEWIADLQREGELKPRNIKNVWKVLRLILGKKRVKDWTIRLPKNPKKEQRWFTVQEMDRIIDAAWGQYKFIFQLARATGMRSGELFGLRVEDLDLESAIVHIRRSTWGHLEVTPKTDAGHREHRRPDRQDVERASWRSENRSGFPFEEQYSLGEPEYKRRRPSGHLQASGNPKWRNARIPSWKDFRIAGEGSSGRPHHKVGRTRESENHESVYPLF
jgi:integrase